LLPLKAGKREKRPLSNTSKKLCKTSSATRKSAISRSSRISKKNGCQNMLLKRKLKSFAPLEIILTTSRVLST